MSQESPAARIGRLEQYLRQDPANAVLQQDWLRALHHAGELRRACEWVAQAEAAGHLAPAAAGVAALAALDFSDLVSAARWALRAQEAGVDNLESLVARATLALAAQDARAASELAQHALRRNARDGRSWSTLAFAQLLAGDMDNAGASFTRAIELMPGHIGTRHGHAWLCILRGDYATARAGLEAALVVDRNFAETHGGLAVVAALEGAEAAARGHIERARRLDPRNASSAYAEAVLNGDAHDPVALRRLAASLLRERAAR